MISAIKQTCPVTKLARRNSRKKEKKGKNADRHNFHSTSMAGSNQKVKAKFLSWTLSLADLAFSRSTTSVDRAMRLAVKRSIATVEEKRRKADSSGLYCHGITLKATGLIGLAR